MIQDVLTYVFTMFRIPPGTSSMKIKPVACCQCGSPLTLFEAPVKAKLVVCGHCSALLEVTPSPGPVKSHLRTEPPPVRASTPRVDLEAEARRLADQIVSLDRRWHREWAFFSVVSMEQSRLQIMTVGAVSLGLIPVCLLAGGRGLVWAILVATLGVLLCFILYYYRKDRRQYEEERNVLYVRLIAIYHIED
jgi:hypothetical protein